MSCGVDGDQSKSTCDLSHVGSLVLLAACDRFMLRRQIEQTIDISLYNYREQGRPLFYLYYYTTADIAL